MAFELSRADRDMMHGVIDMHLHAHPCLLERPFDEIECAEQARAAGYRGLVLKSIYVPNADRVELVRKVVPGIELFGSLVLNHPVGGLNPEAVRAAIGFGVKVIWLPTVHAAHHIAHFGVPTYPWQTALGLERTQTKAPPIHLLDGGELRPEVAEIIALCKAADLVLGTGHIGLDEVMAVLREARRIGYEKAIITHVGWHATDWAIEDTKAMLDLGCTLEFTVNPLMPNRQQARPKDFAERIRAVGAVNCVASTDLGQHDNAHPIEGFRMWLRILRTLGFSEAEIDVMARRNPARLLGLPAAA
jgi:GNAT superfamily N-acetyltransferase